MIITLILLLVALLLLGGIFFPSSQRPSLVLWLLGYAAMFLMVVSEPDILIEALPRAIRRVLAWLASLIGLAALICVTPALFQWTLSLLGHLISDLDHQQVLVAVGTFVLAPLLLFAQAVRLIAAIRPFKNPYRLYSAKHAVLRQFMDGAGPAPIRRPIDRDWDACTPAAVRSRSHPEPLHTCWRLVHTRGRRSDEGLPASVSGV